MNRDEDIFADVLALPTADRAASLDRACAGDSAQRARIEELLAGLSEAKRVMAAPFARRAPLAPSAPEEKPSDRIGRYKLLEQIGEGGCGAVWMAEQEEPVRRRVALKIVKLGMDTKEVIARFEAERQALAMMDHSNIAKIFDAGTTQSGRPYFVMELMRGIPITQFCDEANLPTEQRLNLFIQVCHALHHAHQKGIIHRDIKPSNILVTLHDDVAVPKVIDFGIAKATQGRLTDHTVFTAFQQFIGTPAYMSPEQAQLNALDVDARSDVYSLGVLLYELLTGRPPFDPKSLIQSGIDEIRRVIREVDPPRPSTRLTTLTDAQRTTLARQRGIGLAQLSTVLRGDLDWVVMHCLEKKRTRRYETANDLALDLQRHLHHEPIVARPPSVAYRLGKLVRRHRLEFVAAAMVGLALTLGAAMSVRQARRADRAEEAAAALRTPVPPINPKSIAVLPFANQSEDKDTDAFFADGIHEDILTNLARIGELHVASRTSVMEYRDKTENIRSIARKLGVAFVLEGSVRRASGKVVVTGQLIRAATEERLWAEKYAGDFTAADVFAIQSDLAQKIAAALQAVLSPQEKNLLQRRPTENLAAYELFLRARAIHNRFSHKRDDFETRESLLQSAIELDPKFAGAWGELGELHAEIIAGPHDTTPARFEKAKTAIDRALALDPDSPEVMRNVGTYYSLALNDQVRAVNQFKKLVQLQPKDVECLDRLGMAELLLGRWSETIATRRMVARLDPSNPARSLVGTFLLVRRFGDAIAEQERLIALQPDRPEDARMLAWLPFLATGSTRELEDVCSRLEAHDPNSIQALEMRKDQELRRNDTTEFFRLDRQYPAATSRHHIDATVHGGIIAAQVYRSLGDMEGVRSRLGNIPMKLRARLELEPDNRGDLRSAAMVEAILGNKEEALRRIARAVELAPESTNAFAGVTNSVVRAKVYMWTGDTERALAEFARLLRIPSELNVHEMKAYGALYSPLRGDPRFEALLNDPMNNAPLY